MAKVKIVFNTDGTEFQPTKRNKRKYQKRVAMILRQLARDFDRGIPGRSFPIFNDKDMQIGFCIDSKKRELNPVTRKKKKK